MSPLGKEEADFDYMLTDSGVPVVFIDEAGVETAGFGEIGDADLDQVAAEEGSIAAHETLLTVRRSRFPTLAAGVSGRFIVNGAEYLITQVRETGDGVPLRVWLVPKT